MKNLYCKVGILLIGSVLMTTNILAQVDTTYAAKIKSIFQHIDKLKVPYGLLKDLALEKAQLDNYNGSLLVDSTLVYYHDWADVYLTLTTAQIHANASASLPSSHWVDSLWFAKRQPGQVTLAGLYYAYSRYADDAASKVSVVNDQVYDKFVNGQWQNPYKTEQVLAFAPANTEYPALGFSLYMPPELWLSNQKNQVASIQCDASDGLGYRTLKAGVTFPVFYADTGIKVLNFKIILTNNTVLQSRSVLHVSNSPYTYIPNTIVPGTSVKGNAPANVLPPGNCISGNTDANGLEKILMTSTESYLGKQAKGLITVKYAQADHQLHKPLIVVEGFDTGIYTNPEDLVGNGGLEEFFTKISKSQANDMKDIFINIPQYDIIFIDWQNGTADMRLNALLLKTVIRCVNQVKVDPAVKNVVLGQSMGGLIARYALKKMEDAAENHDTRLYISHDAPHQGANVPLGVQYLAKNFRQIYFKGYMGNIISLFDGQALNKISLANTPASRQLLINYADDNFQVDNTEHIQWQTELQSLGYPQQCRNVAISNGSECGNLYPLTPGTNLLLLAGTIKLGNGFISPKKYVVYPLLAIVSGHAGLLWGMLPGNKDRFLYHFEVNSMASNGGNKAYVGKITFKKKILGFINLSVSINDKTVFHPAGSLTYDNFPGGVFSIGVDLFKVAQKAQEFGATLTIASGFSFIPTPSALDIGGGNVPIGQIDYYNAYVGGNPPPAPKNTPFANFTTAFSNGSSANEEHITFTQRNGNWLAAELNPGAPPQADCLFFCNNNATIAGANCFNSNQVYSIPDIPLGATVIWSVSGSASINGSNNSTSVELAPTGIGLATLKATISNGDCGEKVITKLVNVGILSPIINLASYSQGNVPVYYTFKVTNVNPVLIYKWYVDNVLKYTSQPGESTFFYQGICNTNYEIKCTSSSDCLTSPYSNTLDPFVVCLSAHHLISENSNFFIVYPNPANTEISISVPAAVSSAESIAPSNEISFEVKLYSSSGKLLLTKSNVNNEPLLTLNTQALPTGNYYLHVSYNNQVLKKQILIQH